MQPKNKTERRKAFLNFLLLFVLSIAIIITTAFFSIQVPFTQNDDLRRQINVVQRDRAFKADFLTSMSGIVSTLDTVNSSAKPDLLDGDITENINRLKLKVNADSIYDKVLYQNVVQNMYDLQIAKKQLRELSGKNDNVNDLQKQNDDLRAKLQESQSLYNNLLIQLNQSRK